MLKWNFCL